mgnify:CR=1 FL=1|jgi:hypothetical protein
MFKSRNIIGFGVTVVAIIIVHSPILPQKIKNYINPHDNTWLKSITYKTINN